MEYQVRIFLLALIRRIDMKTKNWILPVLVIVALIAAGCGTLSLPFLKVEKSNTQPPIVVAPTAEAQSSSAPVPSASAEPISGDVLAAYQGTLEQIYSQVNPSVVSLRVNQTSQSPTVQLPQVPGFPFGNNQTPPDQPQSQTALGSGFVWDTDGHIVTNNHVIDGATRITVTFSDGTIREAKVVGADVNSDLAVIKLDSNPEKLVPVTMGDSGQIKVGQMAIAIGDPFGLENTMTVGIVSALGRSLPVDSISTSGASYTIPDIIQTDAPINPGNSGGILLNASGEVIGVTSAIESPVRANAGVGFAIPASIVKNVVPSLIKDGKYTHAWLGVSGTTLIPDLAKGMNLNIDQHGALVVEIVKGSPAEKAGLKGSDKEIQIDGQNTVVGGDVITAINNEPVKTFDDVAAYVGSRASVGSTLTLTILRDGKTQNVDVTLEARPIEQPTSTTAPRTNNNRNNNNNNNQQQPASSVWLGISGENLSPDLANAMNLSADQQGVLVNKVQSNSPADKAGLRGSNKPVTIQGQDVMIGGDVITEIDGNAITSFKDLQTAIMGFKPGDKTELTILRDGKQESVTVTLEQRPNQ
jgi:serine protease Do